MQFTMNAARPALVPATRRPTLDELYAHPQVSEAVLILRAKDEVTAAHCKRTMAYAWRYAEKHDLNGRETWELCLSALFHDWGKLEIETHILRKPQALDTDERRRMRDHPELRVESLCASMSAQTHIRTEKILDSMRYHHERFDGKGYPLRLSGESIPWMARVVAVLDAFDAMRFKRPYKPAYTLEKAISELQNGAGTQFCPRAVKLFLQALDVA